MSIHAAATAFAAKHAATRSEKQHDQNFIRDFVGIFTKEDPASVFRFQYPVRTPDGTVGAIDALWEGHILIEMKTTGKNLEKTLKDQVRPYISYLPGGVQPKVWIISDFQKFLVVDPEGIEHTFTLAELPDNIALFTPIFNGLPTYLRTNGTVNERAAKLLADVIIGLRDNGYPEAHLPVLATRLLFCLYADDNEVWKSGAFHSDVLATLADGTNLGLQIDYIFDLLNKKKADGTKYKYINGGVFADEIPVPKFDAATRAALIKASEYDWRGLDPMIFGTIYQSAMNATDRHAEGAHYTHEEDIIDVLNPILLTDLWEHFEKVRNHPKQLETFLFDLAKIHVLDPACGSGNFLMVTYRELRKLETAAIAAFRDATLKPAQPSRISLSQFHGIEYNELSASIARTAMWLTLHAADARHATAVGELTVGTFPLNQQADIRHGNAVTVDWVAEFPQVTVIVGNPPYVSADAQDSQQQAERAALKIIGGKMDYACIWMVKAAQFIAANPSAMSGYVITDSVVQGTQVRGLWSHSDMQNVYTIGGRQSYIWPGDAKVRVVNLILGSKPEAVELLAEDRTVIAADYVSPYLVPSPVPTRGVAAVSRTAPAWMVQIKQGKAYEDFGHYAKLGDDLAVIQLDHPEMIVNKVSSSNLLSGKPDPVLWFGNRSVAAVKHPVIAKRREAVRKARGAGHPKGPEWLPPVVTGEYMAVPMTYSKQYAVTPIVILTGQNYMTQGVYYAPVDWFMAGLVMSQRAKNAQNDGSGRIGKGGDVRYNSGILYGMPEPANDSPALREKIAAKAKECVDARPGSASDCMKVTNMPSGLAKLHSELDALVNEWWG